MEEDDFDKTVLWSIEEDNVRTVRIANMGISSFYLVIAACFLFVMCFFILYFYNRKKKVGALELMKDPDNIFNEENDENENEDEDDESNIPIIDLSEDEGKPDKMEKEPSLENIVESKAQEVV